MAETEVNVNVDANSYSVKEIVERIEQKLDVRLNDHENRLRWLEKVWWGVPLTAIVSITLVFIR